ncbi:glycosyltransferase family 4 protein [Glutamicibacter sp. AOP3-A1-12]|uniref:glycosyltransferase family 4 protein n=1 Tax=Glutamicibacter sp. AOP3-A1-12 TaxID=3457701 RepID=UPI004034680B
MKKSRKILVTVFARASWGGLHEHVFDEAQALLRSGFDVYVACAESRLATRLRTIGAGVICVDWDDLDSAESSVLETVKHVDLVHAHPFTSRELGLRIATVFSCPVIVTMHGNYLDYANTWATKVDHIVFVSDALRDNFLLNVKGIDSSKTTVIANGVQDSIFQRPPLSLLEKTNQESIRIAVASRLDSDKIHVIRSTATVAEQVRKTFPDARVTVEVLGEGSLSNGLAEELTVRDVEVRFLGWRIAENVSNYLRGAVISVCPGRSAAQSLAVGTPVFAVGSQGPAGLQIGRNLLSGLWSNFGGFPLKNANEGEAIGSLLSDREAYQRAQARGRSTIELTSKQSVVDGKLTNLISSLID